MVVGGNFHIHNVVILIGDIFATAKRKKEET